ncbi:MAG: hypothetical protein HRT90_00905 [Candidatus Margulisbacteria bacterium]|nr:hypothetical protein [Candidatus Margulisiibacteriota bacterium]
MDKKKLSVAKQKSKSKVKSQAIKLELNPFGIQKEKTYKQFQTVLKNILPHIGRDEEKIIQAEVMLALKLEGVIGKELSSEDSKLINIIKDSILLTEGQKEQALMVADRMMKHTS